MKGRREDASTCYVLVLASCVQSASKFQLATTLGSVKTMDEEIALVPSEEQKRNTGIRYDKRGPNYGVLAQDVYTVKDLADTIGVNHTLILQHIKNGRLRALYLGGPAGYRIYRESIIDWVKGIRGSDPINEEGQ